MPDEVKLSEEHRAQLDGIVMQMESNNEPQEAIQAVIEDFKQKYGAEASKKKEATGPLLSSAPLASANTGSLSEAGASAPSIDYLNGSNQTTPPPAKPSPESIDYLKGSNQVDLPQKAAPTPLPNQPVAEDQLRAATSPVETTAKDQTNFDPSANEEIYDSAIKSGLAQAGGMILKSPAMAYDILTATTNKVINEPLNALTGGRVGMMPSSHDIGKQIPEDYDLVGLVDAANKKHEENLSKQYDHEINEYLYGEHQDVKKGLNLLGYRIAQAVPVSVAIGLATMAGASPAQITAGGAVAFGGDKMSQINEAADEANLKLQSGQYAPEEKANLEQVANMPQFTRMTHAAAVGAMEGFFETFGVTKVAKYMKNAVKSAGKQLTKEETKKLAEQTFKEVYGPGMKKYLGAMFEEPLSEAATQFAENVLDWSTGMNPEGNFMKGVKDAALVGMGMGAPAATGGGALEFIITKANRDKAIKLSEQRKAFEEDLKSEDTSESTKAVISQKLHDINAQEADLAQSEKETISNLPPESKQQIAEIQKKAHELATAATDPNLSEESKEILAKDMEKLDGEVEKVIEAAPELQKKKEQEAKDKEQESADELEYLKHVEENIGLSEDEYARMQELEKKTSPPATAQAPAEQKPAGGAQEASPAAPGAEPVATTTDNSAAITELEKKIKDNKQLWFDEKISYPKYRATEDALKKQLQETVSPTESKEAPQAKRPEPAAPEAGDQQSKPAEAEAPQLAEPTKVVAPAKESGSSVEPTVEQQKPTEIKAPEKVVEKAKEPESAPIEKDVATSKPVKEKPKQELIDEEEQADSERKDDPAVVEQMDKDLAAMKQLSKKDLYDKKFAAMIERAWKAKNDKKISRPTYTAFRNAASDVLGGKQNYDKEELKVKVGEIFNNIKKKLLGEGYQKITLSSVSPITPKTVADLIDLAAALTKRGIEAGFAIHEAVQKALTSIKKHPVYKRLSKSGELDEAKFDEAVKENAVNPPKKKKKKKAPQNDQPAEITGEVRKKKTAERQEGSSFKDVVTEMSEDDKFYHSIKEKNVLPHINAILDEVEANNELESLAHAMLNDENPFHDKIKNVAEFMVGERLAVIAEKDGNEMQKSAMTKLAAKLWAHRNAAVNVSATQTAMENIIAQRLPVSKTGLTAYTEAAMSNVQDTHMTSQQQQDVKGFVNDHLAEIMEIEEVKKKLSESVVSEINKISEKTKGKEWNDTVTSDLNSMKINIDNC